MHMIIYAIAVPWSVILRHMFRSFFFKLKRGNTNVHLHKFLLPFYSVCCGSCIENNLFPHTMGIYSNLFCVADWGRGLAEPLFQCPLAGTQIPDTCSS